MKLKNHTKDLNGIFISDPGLRPEDFSKQYHQLRLREKRIYTDAELANLPAIEASHIHHREWMIRKKSSERLIEYLEMKNAPLKILDVGCGNGWLSNKLSLISQSVIFAIDKNYEELKQASFVFSKRKNIHFICGDLDSIIPIETKFDIILFAASIQYFQSLQEVIDKAVSLLSDNGEIHILDSPLYKSVQINAAKERSKKYFESIGFPEMTNYYFHHRLSELKTFRYEILFNPSGLNNYFFKRYHPFYWIRILKHH